MNNPTNCNRTGPVSGEVVWRRAALSKPTDDDILRAVSKFSRQCPTYVIRNILAMAGFREVKTPWVLRQMKRLERQGKVVRVPSSYAVMLCWAEVKP